jgi:hypothetical protein
VNGLLNFKLNGDALAEARAKIESLPGIVDALAKVPAIVRAMPPAPVIVGAVSRMIAGALCAEIEHRGPSTRFTELCASHGLDAAAATEIFGTLVDEVRS